MLIEKKVYNAECDYCNDYFSIDDYNDKILLIRDMKVCHWLVEGKKCYCPECKEDDNVNLP
jgi:hypothetical protein